MFELLREMICMACFEQVGEHRNQDNATDRTPDAMTVSAAAAAGR
jgi:hypothetical protein